MGRPRRTVPLTLADALRLGARLLNDRKKFGAVCRREDIEDVIIDGYARYLAHFRKTGQCGTVIFKRRLIDAARHQIGCQFGDTFRPIESRRAIGACFADLPMRLVKDKDGHGCLTLPEEYLDPGSRCPAPDARVELEDLIGHLVRGASVHRKTRARLKTILRMLAEGYTMRDIAPCVGVTPSAVSLIVAALRRSIVARGVFEPREIAGKSLERQRRAA